MSFNHTPTSEVVNSSATWQGQRSENNGANNSTSKMPILGAADSGDNKQLSDDEEDDLKDVFLPGIDDGGSNNDIISEDYGETASSQPASSPGYDTNGNAYAAPSANATTTTDNLYKSDVLGSPGMPQESQSTDDIQNPVTSSYVSQTNPIVYPSTLLPNPTALYPLQVASTPSQVTNQPATAGDHSEQYLLNPGEAITNGTNTSGK